MKLIRKIKEVGPVNVVVGGIKRLHYKKLIKKYRFDSWHLSPYEWRKYIQECAGYINSHECHTIVDIGCGLGGLLRHVKAEKKIGFDEHEEVIIAARELGTKGIQFETGSFDELSECPVDYLVTLGFMHGSTEATWVRPYRLVAEKNQVQNFIVDVLPETSDHHCLQWEKILPENYKCIDRLGPFLSGRYLEIWSRQEKAD